jgi:RNA polymerase sigma-70 factor (ECF subfamily)
MDELSAKLLTQCRAGDEQAAEIVYRLYARRLLALARQRLSAPLARQLDPEDVVQSAYRSFFAGARSGRYVVRRSGDLWKLLAAITLHKLKRHIERQTTRKRAIHREVHFGGESSLLGLRPHQAAGQPSPSQAVALADTLEQALRGLEPLQRRMVELRVQGCGLEEIAAEVRRSERTVRRVLEQVKDRLQREGLENARL